jgi:DNA-directed DNA polymerase III PolC
VPAGGGEPRADDVPGEDDDLAGPFCPEGAVIAPSEPPVALLEVHSHFSLLRGVARLPDIVRTARAGGISAVALTDDDALYGAVGFLEMAKEAGIRGILGARLHEDTEEGRRSLLTLARDESGYRSISRLVTARRLHPDAFRLTELRAGDVEGAALLVSDPALVEDLEPHLPPGTLHVALPGHPRADLVSLAERLRLPPVATWPAYWTDRRTGPVLHRTVDAIRRSGLVRDDLPAGTLVPPSAHLPSAAEMRRAFRGLPEALSNGVRLAERCDVTLTRTSPIFPRFPLPEGESAFSYLWKLCFEGAAARYRPIRPDVIRRLEYELTVIEKLGFAEYFLIVWDIVRRARAEGIPAVGRGSAADSLVSYTLGISIVDPIEHDLAFERFLSLSRKDCPDIDVDFAWNRRDEVVEQVYERYGHDRVAMVCTYNTFQGRSAFRDVAKAFGIPPKEVDGLSARLPYMAGGRVARSVAEDPECRRFPRDRLMRVIVGLADLLDGAPRHLSLHPCGLVVADRPLTDYVPLERSAKGLVVTQYDKDGIEAIGLVKMDLLGQRTLAVLHDAERSLRGRGVEVDLEALDPLDPATGDLAASGRTIGCFQVESPGMRNLLQMMAARDRRDLTVGLALIRPGPSASGMKEHYVLRRDGEEEFTYLHPALEPVLRETFGVMLYQEDVLRVSQAVAGFTPDEADALRKAMSRARHPESLAEHRERFVRRAVERDVTAEVASRIWDQVEGFSAYSFCKAHATTYGHLSWRACWLKAHHPAEFLAAVLSHHGGFYSPREYLEEARRLGVSIRLPDVNRSEVAFTVEDDGAIRVGLLQVKRLRRGRPEGIVEERRRRLFTSLPDFCRRVPCERHEVEQLVLCGAFDFLDLPRPEMLWRLTLIFDAVKREREGLFGRGGLTETAPEVPRLPDYDEARRVEIEAEVLGLTPTAHPVSFYEEEIRAKGALPSDRLRERVGRHVRIGGWLVTTRRVRTDAGHAMRFVTLEDLVGVVEIILFPDVYRRFGHLLIGPGPYLVDGRVEDHHGAIVVRGERLAVLDPE